MQFCWSLMIAFLEYFLVPHINERKVGITKLRICCVFHITETWIPISYFISFFFYSLKFVWKWLKLHSNLPGANDLIWFMGKAKKGIISALFDKQSRLSTCRTWFSISYWQCRQCRIDNVENLSILISTPLCRFDWCTKWIHSYNTTLLNYSTAQTCYGLRNGSLLPGMHSWLLLDVERIGGSSWWIQMHAELTGQ